MSFINSLLPLLPIGILISGAVIIMIVDAFFLLPGKRAGALAGNFEVRKRFNEIKALEEPEEKWTLERSGASAIFFLLAFFSTAILISGKFAGSTPARISNSLIFDTLSIFGILLIAGAGFLSSLTGGGYFNELKADRGGFFPIILLTSAGAMVLSSAGDMIVFFVGLEAMSLGAYSLTGFRIVSPRSIEGSMKYFLLGSFASALMLYGFALIYGETGAIAFEEIGNAITKTQSINTLLILGMLLVLSGLCFKIAAVPFHMWTPEAYQGAPTPSTGFMATVIKSAGFIAMIRVLGTAFKETSVGGPPFGWAAILGVVCIATMFWGNLAALKQKNIKRMLAYSSIAHAGYMLVGVVAGWVYPSASDRSLWAIPDFVRASIIYYLATYIVANAGAFAVISMVCGKGAEATSIEDYRGFGRRHPVLAAALSIFLLSLLGMPPLGGFFAKLYVFRIAVESNLWLLALLGMIASVISAYYYLGVIVVMYMKEKDETQEETFPIHSFQMETAIAISFALVLFLGIYPSPLLSFLLS